MFKDLTLCKLLVHRRATVCKDKQPFTLTCRHFLHNIGLLEEAGELKENPHMTFNTTVLPQRKEKVDHENKTLRNCSRWPVVLLFAATEILHYQAIIVYSERTAVLLSHRWHWQNKQLLTERKMWCNDCAELLKSIIIFSSFYCSHLRGAECKTGKVT